MVFQNYALYPHMTVEENMAFGLRLRHTPKADIKRRVSEAAALLGLKTYLKRKPAALSGGKSLWTARVSPRSPVGPGTALDLAVDTTRLHFFDPVTAEAIG